MKYIDAERLKAEVKRIKNDNNHDSFVSGLAYLGKEEAIDEFCSLIDSLQQEQLEVDLDELINDFLLNNSEFLVERDSKVVVQKLARHFYELGTLANKQNNEKDSIGRR